MILMCRGQKGIRATALYSVPRRSTASLGYATKEDGQMWADSWRSYDQEWLCLSSGESTVSWSEKAFFKVCRDPERDGDFTDGINQ